MFRLLCVTICRWLVRPLPCSVLSEVFDVGWAERRQIALLFLPEKGACSRRDGLLPARLWLVLPPLGQQVGFLWVCSMLLLVLH